MSDIFSLNGCYLSLKNERPFNSCTAQQLKNAKTLLSSDTTSEVNTVATALITDAGTIENIDDAKIIKSSLTNMETTALNEKNTMRSIQINTYYAKKRTDQNYILKVVYIMVLVVAIMWAVQTYTNILPDWFFSAGMAITIGICSIIIIFKAADISNRSNFDYDQKIGSMKNLPPLGTQDSIYTPDEQTGAQSNSYNQFGKNCQNGECCPKFFSFNPSLGYCSFNPFINK